MTNGQLSNIIRKGNDEKWGVSNPLSTALPTDDDLLINEIFITELLKAERQEWDDSENQKAENEMMKLHNKLSNKYKRRDEIKKLIETNENTECEDLTQELEDIKLLLEREETVIIKMLQERREKIQNMKLEKEEASHREKVLVEVTEMAKEWLRDVSCKKGFSKEMASESGGGIFTFGSYRLGVHGPDADLDTVLVAPVHIEREHFFNGKDGVTPFHEILEKHPKVTDIQPVPDAYVPVVKCVFDGIHMDLLFARLAHKKIDPRSFNTLEDKHLSGVDEQTQRSLNGTRVADKILQLVPNLDTFRIVLRCIKIWAKQRAVYGNVYGYPGGVSWAILVARVCQLYPKAVPAVIVCKFFQFYSLWKWPNPITLDTIMHLRFGFKVWDSKNDIKDRKDVAPVITPCYPSMNSTYNISKATLEQLQEEWRRGQLICEDIVNNKKDTWKDLWEKSDFFKRYSNYLQIYLSADNEPDYLRWQGFVESKLRQLVLKLELIPDLTICVYPRCFRPPRSEKTVVEGEVSLSEGYWFYGLKMINGTKRTVDFAPIVEEWRDLLYHIILSPYPRSAPFPRTASMHEPVITPIRKKMIPPWIFKVPIDPISPTSDMNQSFENNNDEPPLKKQKQEDAESHPNIQNGNSHNTNVENNEIQSTLDAP